MLAEALEALAAAGGTAVVQAAGTEAWAAVRERVVRLFSRSGSRNVDAVSAELDRLAAGQEGAAGSLESAATTWRSHFEGLLQQLDGPDRESAVRLLRELVGLSGAATAVTALGNNSLALGGDARIVAERGGLAAATVGTAFTIGRTGVAAGRVDQLNVYMQNDLRTGATTLSPPLARRHPHRPPRGREALLETLADLLTNASGGAAHILHGMGGSGKTTLALETAHHATTHGIRVWWIGSADKDALASGLLTVARQAGATDEEIRTLDRADVLWDALERYDQQWLLVVDGVDDPRLLDNTGRLSDGTGWIRPHRGSGLVLVTTRNGAPEAWGPGFRLHHVDGLASADPDGEPTEAPSPAAQVLIDYAGSDKGSLRTAEALAERLGGLPLALRLAGSYIADVSEQPWPDAAAALTFSAYQQALEEGRHGRFDPNRVIRGATMLNLDQLASRGMSQARPLIQLLSSFAEAPLPYVTVLRPDRVAAAAPLGVIDGAQLWRLLKALADLSLIELDGVSVALPMLRLHPLVRDAARTEEPPWARTTAGLLLNQAVDALRDQVEDPSSWPQWHALAPHVFRSHRLAVEAVDDDEAIVRAGTAALAVARYLDLRGLYSEAENRIQQVYLARRDLFGDHNPATLDARYNLARMARKQGRLEEAEAELRTVAQELRRLLGEDDAGGLLVRHAWAMVLRELGRLEEAELEHREVWRIRARIYGEDHPDTLNSRYSLARMARERGDLPHAEAEYRSVHRARQQVLGERHPDTLATRHSLAVVARRLGRWDEAEAGFQEVLAARIEILGAEHPYTLITRTELALLAWERGDLGSAECELTTVLEMRTRALGESHPQTAWTAANLQHVRQLRSGTPPTQVGPAPQQGPSY
ncbi:tetratricopeptide repeat protein [Streptomyces sp. NRRL S-87]|uniref:tetratricopeptide repeat protein n=1 Tax=Streptomyces sp. NRRL S-87 TaxID=1463920 RepID=UPI0004C0CFB3|nr:tetratricopeptide repeat protein [Streptomyces sp. NRRL S-87]